MAFTFQTVLLSSPLSIQFGKKTWVYKSQAQGGDGCKVSRRDPIPAIGSAQSCPQAIVNSSQAFPSRCHDKLSNLK